MYTKEGMDSEKEDHELNVEVGNKILQMTQTPGWREIVAPKLEAMRKKHLEQLLYIQVDKADSNDQIAKKYIEARMALQSIDTIINLVDICLFGKEYSQKELNRMMMEGDGLRLSRN